MKTATAREYLLSKPDSGYTLLLVPRNPLEWHDTVVIESGTLQAERVTVSVRYVGQELEFKPDGFLSEADYLVVQGLLKRHRKEIIRLVR